MPIASIYGREGFNPRADDTDDLASLTASIQQRGLLQPLVVSPNGDGYHLVDGHRRFQACLAAGLTDVPVLIRDTHDEAEQLVDAVTANSQRVDLSPIEEAKAFQRLKDSGRGVKQIASELAVSQKLVTERLKLLTLPEALWEHVDTGTIGLGHVDRLVEMNKVSPDLCTTVANTIIEGEIPAQRFNASPLRGLRGHANGIWITHGTIDPETIALSEKAQEQWTELKGLQSWTRSVALSDSDLSAGKQYGCVYEPKTDDAWDEVVAICDEQWLTDVVERRITSDLRKARKTAREVAKSRGEEPAEPLTEEQAKEARKADREAELAARDEKHAQNQALGSELLVKHGSLELDRTKALHLAALLLRGTSHELAVNGIQFTLPHYTQEETQKNGKTKRTYLAKKATDEVAGFITAGETPEQVLGRLLIVLASAAQADHDVVARSNQPPHVWVRETRSREAVRGLLGHDEPSLLEDIAQKAKETAEAIARGDEQASSIDPEAAVEVDDFDAEVAAEVEDE